MADLIENVCDHFPISIFCYVDENEKEHDVTGAVESVENDIAHVKPISKAGDWIDELHPLNVNQVTEMLFGSEYEKRLIQIAQRSES